MTPEPDPFETKVMVVSDDLTDAISERFRDATARSVQGAHDLVALASIRAEAVRAPLDSDLTSTFRIDLPPGLPEQLGSGVETHLIVGDGHLRVWLAGAELLDPDSTMTFIAVSPTGESAHAVTTAETAGQPIRVTLDWPHPDPPTALGLFVKAKA